MSQLQREIVKQSAPLAGVVVQSDDRFLTRWVINMGAPISLADFSGSRFVGKFDDDVLPAKRLVSFAPGMARSTGLYEHPAFIGTQSDMGSNHANSMLTIPVNSESNGSSAPLTAYNNNPKLCAYMLMRDYEKRGLCLFETVKGLDDEEILELFDLIIPPHIEAGWAKETRTVLDHTFKGPFLSQYKDWLGTPSNSPMKTWFNANIGNKKGFDRAKSDRHAAMVKELRAATMRAWSFENSTLNSSEQQIRRYRNGKNGKEFYDMPDERFDNPVPPLDLICLADTGRAPIDLQDLAAAEKLNEGSQAGMVAAMESFGEKLAEKLQPGISAADIEAIIERRLSAQQAQWETERAEWQAKIEALQREEAPEIE